MSRQNHHSVAGALAEALSTPSGISPGLLHSYSISIPADPADRFGMKIAAHKGQRQASSTPPASDQQSGGRNGRSPRGRHAGLRFRAGGNGLKVAGAAAIRPAETAMTEAWRIIDLARVVHADLRLAGALAANYHCPDGSFACRKCRRIKLVGRASQVVPVHFVLSRLGYGEDHRVAQASHGRVRRYKAVGGSPRARRRTIEQLHLGRLPTDDRPPVDEIDIHFDVGVRRGSYDATLRKRLDLYDYAISPSDALLDALRGHESDGRAVCTLLKHLGPAAAERARTINIPYVAQLCSADWELYQDLISGFDTVERRLGDYRLSREDCERVKARLRLIRSAVVAHKKTFGWHMRARLGVNRRRKRPLGELASARPTSGDGDRQPRTNASNSA